MPNKYKLLPVNANFYNYSPDTSGVYIFYGEDKKPIYVGKAVSLRKRLYSYSLSNLEPKTKRMVSLARYFSFICVSSEIEALILEAKMIGTLKPKYNIALKDDKSPVYILITKEKYPRVITARLRNTSIAHSAKFGPFLSGRDVTFVLKNIRKAIHFSSHKPEKRPCLYSQLGLCNPCPSNIERLMPKQKKNSLIQYRRNIKAVIRILNGNIQKLIRELSKEMLNFSEKQDFESAAQIKYKIDTLKRVTTKVTPGEYFIDNPNLKEGMRLREIGSLTKYISGHMIKTTFLRRIECYDVAHTSGSIPVASMVTFIEGDPSKALYRQFKITQKNGASDVFSMRELSQRRVKHFSDWGKPDLVIVDGGKGQVSAVQEILLPYKIPVVGLSKPTNSLVIPKSKIGDKFTFESRSIKNREFFGLITRLDSEAHRFSRKLHHKLLHNSYGFK